MSTSAREERFRALYAATRARVTSYALRRTPSVEDAADAMAETFAIAWRRFETVPSGDRAIYWLYATCRRVIANDRRRDQRRRDLVQRIGAELHTTVRDPLSEGGHAMVAALALASLSADDREALLLVGWEGLNSAQLAGALGCSSAAARIRLHRARVRLTAEMQRLGLDVKQADPPGHSSLRAPAHGGADKEASEP